ncbi:ABC transporter ATP-binding protein [Terriglobus saanensis]|uniref:ABC transporter related protein n=1 Tax=Terriglobus saanensis (strain ATCC BAA-1853 / DSM 23119 / SP1PR4) TaxID=401053 RepID=E8V8I8_TERSS|nr:ABC transporter ATP-binding protein [Terriglobus saanensis]ADV82967.1 ABC transporter related protein [Terriglobus saanensis SP1PR4]
MLDRLKPLRPYLKRYRASLAWGGLSVVLYNCSKIVMPLLIGRAIDHISRHVGERDVAHDAVWLLVVAVAAAIFLYLTRWIIIGASREIEFDLRNDLFANLERQPPAFYHEHRTGDIMARTTNDLNAVRQLLGPAIMYSANTVVFTLAALPFMIRMSPRLTIFAFLPLPAASLLVQTMGRRIHRRFERIQAMFSDISAQAQENFSGARLVRAFAQEEAEVARFETANQEYIRRSLMLVRLMAMLWPTLEFVLGISLVATLFFGGREVVQHRLSVGQFTAYMVYMVQLIWPMIALGWVVNLFQRGTASVERIDQLLRQKPAIWDEPAVENTVLPEIRGDIEFRGLTFRYGAAEILRDIDLTIPAGTSLAIVGPTGSGKSTLVNLVPRLLDAEAGMVLIDGRPIREWSLAQLREGIGFVPQETFLFSTSIRDNISFGVREATPAQVREAAVSAHIATEIEEFPAGFDTLVGERGITLSGGQKQRTSIARALLRNPRILILDDALASVDTYTEERILLALREQMKGRTTIFISHRVSTAQSADRIAVLVDGRIVETGTHEELLSAGGYYRGLYQKQQLEEEIAVVA